MRTSLALFVLLAGCPTPYEGADDTSNPVEDTAATDTGDSGPDDTDTDTDTTSNPGPLGFIGSPCESDDDCTFDGAVCLFEDDGFPGGTCSAPCELYCDDRAGHPTTFCVSEEQLPPGSASDDGMCLSRCDLGEFPDSGCREDYGCAVVSRANESWTETYACLPNEPSELSQCHLDLAARGVDFEPIVVPDQSPSGHPGLTCHVEDPVRVSAPIHGVDVLYANDTENSRMWASCEMAHSLVDTIDDAKANGAAAMRHLGTYNCRVISGTNSLSRHGMGDAIDISAFEMANGQTFDLVQHWEHDTSNPQGTAAAWLYDAAYRWHAAGYWNIILTPNYNSAHDNHFHVDLTPGSDYIGWFDGPYIGPAPYDD